MLNRRRMKPLQVAEKYIESSTDQDGLIVKYIDDFIGLYQIHFAV